MQPNENSFGQGQIAAIGSLIPADARILLLYGGGSIKSNGVHNQTMAALQSRHVDEFGGVEANPHYETLQKASALARASGSTFVLGVGGGSVIDAAKFLASMIATGLEDPWDRLVKEGKTIKAVPNGAILTLPATGSESNPVSVISSSTRCPPNLLYSTRHANRIVG